MTPEWVGAIIAIATAVVTVVAALVGAAIAWTRNTEQLKQVRNDLRAFRSWHTGQIDSLSGKHHELRDEVQDHEVRLAVLEARSGVARAIPRPVKRDRTPGAVNVGYHGGSHGTGDVPRARDPEDSGAT